MMSPNKIKNLLMMAALLLIVYWSFVNPNDDGMAYSLGLLLGAGAILYRKKSVELVVVVAVLAILVGVLEIKNGIAAQYAIGLLTGLIAPWIAMRMNN